MGKPSGAESASAKLEEIVENRKNALGALCRRYGLEAENRFGQKQRGDYFWANRTGDAMRGVKGFSGIDGEAAWWGLAHMADHGPWLERMGAIQATRTCAPRWNQP